MARQAQTGSFSPCRDIDLKIQYNLSIISKGTINSDIPYSQAREFWQTLRNIDDEFQFYWVASLWITVAALYKLLKSFSIVNVF